MYINVFSDCMLPANLVICMNSDRITNLFYSPCYTMLKADVQSTLCVMAGLHSHIKAGQE